MEQMDLAAQTSKRDEALDRLEAHRGQLIAVAREVAVVLAKRNGRVTSPEVVRELMNIGFEAEVNAVDKRFMGGVFRAGQGWERIGFETLGSHRQPISVWRLRSA